MLNIIGIYDNGGNTLDRYTVVIDDLYDNSGLVSCLCCSNNPTHPMGFSQFSGCNPGKHLGKYIEPDELPKNVWNHVKSRLSND